MIKPHTNMLRSLYALADVILIVFSYYFSEWLWIEVISDSGNFLQRESMRGYVFCAVFVYVLVVMLMYSLTSVYKSFRYKNVWRIWLKTSFIHATLVGMIMVALYIFRVQDVSRGTLAMFFIMVSLLTLAKHAIAIGLLRAVRFKGYNQKHIVLIGSGELAREYVDAIEENKRYGITIDGYISDCECETLGNYLGEYDVLEQLIIGSGVDEVVVALDGPEIEKVSEVISCCEKCGTRVSVIPFYNNMISERPSINIVGDLKCFALRSSPLDDVVNSTMKRVFDIAFSLFVILLTSPVMLVVALLIKITSPGPVLFKQTRVGKDKKLFTMYKLRSMRLNDESVTAWSTNKDSRRTWIGSFIRKTSIDELPQFFNVLKGDMSIIGPRPEIPFFVDQFRETIPRYMIKHLVRPGITGWAQVNGYRGDTSIEERIKCDIWYIENWSTGLEFKILLRTIFGGMINNEKMNK